MSNPGSKNEHAMLGWKEIKLLMQGGLLDSDVIKTMALALSNDAHRRHYFMTQSILWGQLKLFEALIEIEGTTHEKYWADWVKEIVADFDLKPPEKTLYLKVLMSKAPASQHLVDLVVDHVMNADGASLKILHFINKRHHQELLNPAYLAIACENGDERLVRFFVNIGQNGSENDFEAFINTLNRRSNPGCIEIMWPALSELQKRECIQVLQAYKKDHPSQWGLSDEMESRLNTLFEAVILKETVGLSKAGAPAVKKLTL